MAAQPKSKSTRNKSVQSSKATPKKRTTRKSSDEQKRQLALADAVQKHQAVIEFDLDGKILWANENFLAAFGYTLDEVVGQHHRMFADPVFAASEEYRSFWADLGRGTTLSGDFQRVANGGRIIWIHGAYNPVLDAKGKPFKVVKYATDITAEKIRTSDFEGQLEAIGKSQAVIEFDLEGNILTANENFLKTLGYELEEVQGQHHRMFVDAEHGSSHEYRQFWTDLARGKFKSSEFQRFGKDGQEIWIQASYNPIFDPSGKPYKVVKFATDTTAVKLRSADVEGQLEAINKAQAVIEFDLEGNILTANENFLQ